jgi:flagellar biosynthesis protein FlhA
MTGRLAASFAVRTFYSPTIMLALALMAVIVMMVLPVPAWLVDAGLTLSFALAILTFMVTLFIERPLDFSAFPTVLLSSLVLRLSLNVSSTKLIIGQGHTGTDAAGGVIEGFASFVMGGNLLLGVVVFGVLLIVNFIVITKGAGRMAEVGARFALDGMPGKQLAIDSDVSAGAIDHKEASERRRREQEETTFFGSLDGAAKFVKGDAVAGLLITFLNLVVGMTMGMVYFGMPMSSAFETYAILTVGDGLVSQIPSVIISVAAALLIAKGGVLGSADKALIAQLGGHPGALGVVAALMVIFALVPGLPFVPFILGALALGSFAWWSHQGGQRREAESLRQAEAEASPKGLREQTLGDHLDVDEIRVEFSKALVPTAMDPHSGICARIGNMRRNIASDLGFVIPEVRLTDNPLLEGFRYLIKIQAAKVAQGEVMTGRVLVIKQNDGDLELDGIDVAEPVYGAPARWIDGAAEEEAKILGLPVATPSEVMATHLMEVVKAHIRDLVDRPALQRLLDEFVNVSNPRKAEANRRLLGEMIPDPVPRDLLQAVLRALLDEQVSVRNLPLILESIAEARGGTDSVDGIVEAVRRRLSLQITHRLLGQGDALPLIQLGPAWDELFRQHEARDANGAIAQIALPPTEIKRLASSVGGAIREAASRGHYPAIAVPGSRRRVVRLLLEAGGIRNPVLAFEEIGTRCRPAFVGVA